MTIFRCLLPFLIFLIISREGYTQRAPDMSATLFTVGDHKVSISEFVYLYRKNHQHKPDSFTNANIEEYLDLYVRYKLKVAEALDRGMDTTASFRNEYETYRTELLKPHLGDAAMVDSLVAMTYQRMQEEIRAAHILVQVAPDADPQDTLAAWNKLMQARTRAVAGEDFSALAAEFSEEPGAAARGGDLGYFTALQMVFPFEEAAYSTPVGGISMPVRTRFGYHIVKVLDRRPSRGEVEVSHIMVRSAQNQEDTGARERIFEIHDRLQKGMEWDEVCKQFSEDHNTRETGGRLRPFGVGAMNAAPAFQEMAFSLQNPGEISDPVQSPFGWHILRLEARVPLPPLEEIKSTLTQRVRRDERMSLAVQAQRKKLLQRFGYQENGPVVAALLEAPDHVPAGHEVLFALGERSYHVDDFEDFTKHRPEKASYTREKLDAFVDEVVRSAVEKKLLNESPDFKWLLQEYYEGILLFEIMEKEIWNKALEDSAAQRKYFDTHRGDYQAGERVRASIYSSSKVDNIPAVKKMLEEGRSADDFARENGIRIDSGVFERKDRLILGAVPWESGIHSAEQNGVNYLVHIKGRVDPGPQSFEEARPAVISDYQSYLEDAWIQELKRKFAVRVDKKAKKRAVKHLLTLKEQPNG